MEKEQYINSVNLKAGTDFPYLVMEVINGQSYPRNPGFHVMHWHEDIQFMYVLEGEIRLTTLLDTTIVHPGQCIYINKNIVHRMSHDGNCHYYIFVFPDYLLKFYMGSPAAKFVEKITEDSQLSTFLFTDHVPWCETVFRELEALAKLEKNKTEDYVYEVLVRLTTIWLVFARHLSLSKPAAQDFLNTRMKAFLQYIGTHYAEEISLDQLAESASVSKSECMRCFKKSVQMTPYKYLMEYRLSKACDLLRSTDRPIGTIALDVGFRQTSHFGKCFKEKTGFTPREYRAKKI